MVYNRYSDYLKRKYGCSVYKLPINLDVSCPNRENGGLGCFFCGEAGTGFEALPNSTAIGEQLRINAVKMRDMYKAEKFIAYFQNFTNTYMEIGRFRECIYEAAEFARENRDTEIVEIAVSTRPDCIAEPYLRVLDEMSREYGIAVSLELGLQTVNYRSLYAVNRGHGLAEFVDAVLRIKPYGFGVCAHVILNLPADDDTDAIETAKVLSALRVEQVKLHALYLLKGTPLAEQYMRGEVKLISKDEYIGRVILFLEHLSPEIVVQRVIGRSPLNGSVFANWGISWWKIHDEIQSRMINENRRQGVLCGYLGGGAVKKFI
jgi:hypothetical protein